MTRWRFKLCVIALCLLSVFSAGWMFYQDFDRINKNGTVKLSPRFPFEGPVLDFATLNNPTINNATISNSTLTGTSLFGNGDMSAPSISFTSNPGSGFYNVSGTVGLAVNGAQKHFFNSNMNIATDAGCLAFGASSDTGICRPSASIFAFGNGTSNNSSGSLNFFGSAMGGLVTKYNNINTSGQGLTPVYAVLNTVNYTPQVSGDIATTTLYAVPASGAGLYRVTCSLEMHVAGSGGTATVTLGWNNGDAAKTSTACPGSMGLNSAVGVENTGQLILTSAASQNITYAVAFGTVTLNPQITIRLRVEAL